MTSTCHCQSPRSFYDRKKSISIMSCKVYDVTHMWEGVVEVQKCGLCKSGWVGPDCSESGYFNWNNRMVFTHELLNDYTNAFTTSETPFVAWVTVVARRYQSKHMEFVSEKTFRAAWFAYARLLELKDDMICPKCGPTPKVTVWDGITLSFSRKHLLPTLQPPTTIHPQASHRQSNYPVKPQHITSSQLRNQIVSVLQVPTTLEELGKKVKTVISIIRGLNGIDSSLARVFEQSFLVQGAQLPTLNKNASKLYREFFLQIAAEESALQMTTRPVLYNLEKFMEDTRFEKLELLTMVPCLYNVLGYELSCPSRTIPKDLLGVCRWLLKRGFEVLSSMIEGKPKAMMDVATQDELGHWEHVRQTPLMSRCKGAVLTTYHRQAAVIPCPRLDIGHFIQD